MGWVEAMPGSDVEERVYERVRDCLRWVVSQSGHMASYAPEQETFEITEVEQLEDGDQRFAYTVEAMRESEFTVWDEENPPETEPVEGEIVLDDELGFTFDEEGRLRHEPQHILHPDHWGDLSHPAVQEEDFERMVRPG